MNNNPIEVVIHVAERGVDCSIVLNGVDVSRWTRSFSLHADVHESSSLTIEFVNINALIKGSVAPEELRSFFHDFKRPLKDLDGPRP